MDKYHKNTLYIVGDSKTAMNNPITAQFNAYFIAIIIDKEKEVIIDAGVSTLLEETRQFVKSIFIGYSMKNGENPLIEEIKSRYYGSSQKALIVAWKDAYKKYTQIINSKR
ncbi:DUF3870 domain-containing protein [Paramaledivibacter caminithermalis]|jgi:hypothetical protein|uniref:DUF3870 domain-containing protein n=1 Tax=Paramaledivibacter caminithermalis (strain DSM 15212 / CIP 107654 / DViRD3) TaxID=1121301 RepID=A0A1M6PV05_PARC5|nr:DUF3870 domain-containing protein [Paramaledivibacter caminithermalis]SHK11795.1 protein of unknown function [Paramaledivibacter caminithermalis DSM 15212]